MRCPVVMGTVKGKTVFEPCKINPTSTALLFIPRYQHPVMAFNQPLLN